MKISEALGESLSLLSKRDRRHLFVASAAQMSTALLDLVGVLLIGLVTAIAMSAIGGGQPPQIVSDLLQRVDLSDADTLTIAAWMAVVAALVLMTKSMLNIFLTRRVLRFLANRQAMVAERLAAALLSQPLMQVQKRSSQSTAYALTSGVNNATLIVLGQATIVATEGTLLVILALGLLLLSPWVTLFAILFFAGVALLLHRLLAGWAGRLGEQAQEAEVASYSLIQESLRTYRETVVSHRRASYSMRFAELRWGAARVQSDIVFMSLVPKYIFEFALVIGAGLLAGSQLLTSDTTNAIALIALFLAAGSRIVPSMLRLQGALLTMRGGIGQAAPTYELASELAASDRADASLDSDRAVPSKAIIVPSDDAYPDFNPILRVNTVHFKYPGASSEAVSDVSLKLEPGHSLAIVGPTGSGKTTLADLILGVLHANTGQVTIGGLDPNVAVAKWPGALAYVPQDVAMINGTVRENVGLGIPARLIDDERVWQALKRSQMDDVLRQGREGLDTLIGEHGMRLSGGQRQRLGLARALYSKPRFLVLDEATSALDSETESLIGATLASLGGQVTLVIVAHRLASVTNCDVVAYLEGGRLLAAGSFLEVRAQVPAFDRQARLLGL